MKRALAAFSHTDTMEWFESEGIPYVVQDDFCVFPESQDAMQIVRTLLSLMKRFGVSLITRCRITGISPCGNGFALRSEGRPDEICDRVVVTTGGGALGLLEGLGLEIEKPAPSLYTLRIQNPSLNSLMGAVVEDAVLGLAGTRFRASGPLLLTDWGVSGPATLKLSSYAARYLADNSFKGTLIISWTGSATEQDVRSWISSSAASNPRRLISSVHPESLSGRVWKHILDRCGLREDIRWSELGTKGAARLASTLTADSYPISGRCRFKEEFVTAGGVSLSEIDLSTCGSRKYPGLYFAGEVLDVDAITGGFNLQAAWSTAMSVARAQDRVAAGPVTGPETQSSLDV